MSNDSPDRIRRSWLLRLIEGIGIALLVVLGVGVVAQIMLWQSPDDDLATAPSSSAPIAPSTSVPLESPDTVFEQFGASVSGTTVTFPDEGPSDVAIVFDCTGWSVVLDGFHARFAIVGECDDVSVVGTHIDAYIEQAATLTMEGVHGSVHIGAAGDLTVLGSHNTVVADTVDMLAGDGSFPQLVVNSVAEDRSDFTFGTAAVAQGLVSDEYEDSFKPELLTFDPIPMPVSSAETRILAADVSVHECTGERLIVRDRAPDQTLSISGECDTVIVMDRAQIEIAEATTVVVLETNQLLDLGAVQTFVALEFGVSVDAESIESVIVGTTGVGIDADRIDAIVALQSAADVTWRAGVVEGDITAPEGATGFSGP